MVQGAYRSHPERQERVASDLDPCLSHFLAVGPWAYSYLTCPVQVSMKPVSQAIVSLS